MPHVDGDALERSLSTLTLTPDDAPDVQEVLGQVVGAARALLSPAGVGLMLADDSDALRYVAGSDERSRRVEQVQIDTGEGPCVDCFVSGETVTAADLGIETRWPTAGPALLEAGIRSVVCVPTRCAGGVVGSLNAFAADASEWDDSDVGALRAFNALVEAQLASAVATRSRSALVDQLRHALDNRVLIERAVGFLMAREGLDAAAAFERLRGTARRERVRVAAVAERVLRRP